MFRQRLLTTLLLMPLVLLLILYSSSGLFRLAMGLIIIACSAEWFSLVPIKNFSRRCLFLLLLFILIWLMHQHFTFWLGFGLLLWLAILLAVITFPASQQQWGYPAVLVAVGLVVLALFTQAMLQLRAFDQGRALIIYLLFLVWAADIGAYLVGRRFGRHKLIPQVSPGKTKEGLLGGCFLAMMIAAIGYFYFQPPQLFWWFVVALLTVFISILGDLFFSMLKRRVHLKDSGHLIPGHGGILDRLDSLIAAAPLFYYGLRFFVSG